MLVLIAILLVVIICILCPPILIFAAWVFFATIGAALIKENWLMICVSLAAAATITIIAYRRSETVRKVFRAINRKMTEMSEEIERKKG